MQQFLSQIPLSASANWADGILFCLLLFYGLQGLVSGFVYATFDFIKFVVAFLFGLLFYGYGARILFFLFHMPKGYANTIGFFLGAFLTEFLLHFLLRSPVKKVHSYVLSQGLLWKRMNTILGIFPGLLSGAVLAMFIVTVLTALPVSPFLKHAITNSKIGSFFAARSEVFQKNVAGVFGGAAEETLNFLTVEPQSNTSVSLGFTTQGVVDEAAETAMLSQVNNERNIRGIAALVEDATLQKLARDYASEMLMRGYFSHYTPEGLSPFDRMNQRNISFTYAGENLAFSANETLAMQGLMNSQGHRENILSKNFHKVGIGVMDAGIYGEMFVQEFTD